jgi:CRP/FNR family cyclic AMP-dependent transcriptional regulator
MGRSVDATDIRDLLARNLEHPRWDEVAERCLTCGNCTMVCPTCFCTSVEDVTDLTGDEAERVAVVGLVLLGRPLLHPRRQHPPVGPLALPPVADPQVRHLVRPVRQLGLRRLRALHRLVPGRDRRDRRADRDPRRRGWESVMETIEQILQSVPLFAGLTPPELELIAGCGSNVQFEGELLFRDGDQADTFYVLRHGSVALETFVPTRGAVTIETLEAGEVVGWSWLFPPHRWHFDARALSLVRATSFDGACLRGSASRPALGYDLMSRFTQIVIERLQWTRLRLLDVYGYAATAEAHEMRGRWCRAVPRHAARVS